VRACSKRSSFSQSVSMRGYIIYDKCFQNGPAYFTMAISYRDKMFMKSTPGDNVINFLHLYITNLHNKLECLSTAIIKSLVKCLWIRQVE
jgi:hypothetical protein